MPTTMGATCGSAQSIRPSALVPNAKLSSVRRGAACSSSAIGNVGASAGCDAGTRALRNDSMRSTSARMPSGCAVLAGVGVRLAEGVGFGAGGGAAGLSWVGSGSGSGSGSVSGADGGAFASSDSGAGSSRSMAGRRTSGSGSPGATGGVAASCASGSASEGAAGEAVGIGSARSATPSRSSTCSAPAGRSRRWRRKPRARIGRRGISSAHSASVSCARYSAAPAIE